jgi:hypothetical protein
MTEKLFGKNELLEIESIANSDPDLVGTFVVSGDSNDMSILTVSICHGLIFVEGNSDTGFEHIRLRHSFDSTENYWKAENEVNYKLDNPSKFNPQMMPILDYVKIADSIYKAENKNITKNNRPESFDKYSGEYNYSGGKTEKYHLLIYKDTKIVHSMFPNKKKHNIKNKCKYGKGIVTTLFSFADQIDDLTIPYQNENKEVVYTVLFRKFYSEKIERQIIQRHDKQGIPIESFLIGQKTFNDFERFRKEDVIYCQHTDLSDYEEIINQIDNRKKL